MNIDVLDDDSDAEGDPLVVAHASDPAHGSARVNGDGTPRYVPDSGYVGEDAFT